MKYHNGNFYVEVKKQKLLFQPYENIILRERKELKSLRTHYQVQNDINNIRNRKHFRNDQDETEVKIYAKWKKPKIEKPNPNLLHCLSCTLQSWIEFDKGNYCSNCDFIINKKSSDR